jgi:hypothetical protein
MCLSGHADNGQPCPFLGLRQTLHEAHSRSACEPLRTSASHLRIECKQLLGVRYATQRAMRRWAIKPVNELRRHLVGAERMVGLEQQMLRTEHLVATGKRLVVIAHGAELVRKKVD